MIGGNKFEYRSEEIYSVGGRKIEYRNGSIYCKGINT